MMIGRAVEQYFPQHLSQPRGEVALSVKRLSSAGQFADVSFDLRAGEILGFAGLVGSGRSEVAKAIFGLDKKAIGDVELFGKPLRLGNVRAAMRRGIGLVPEDRKRQGLVLSMSGRANMSMAMLDRLSRFGLLDFRRERREAARYFQQLRVKSPSLATPVGRALRRQPAENRAGQMAGADCKVLIVDEPTRGVDVGAKAAIHAIIDDLAKQGIAILLISSELPEVINLSTRIVVLRHGRIVGEIPRDQATQDRVVRMMAGVEATAA